MRQSKDQSFDYAFADEGDWISNYPPGRELRKYGIRPSVVSRILCGEVSSAEISALDRRAAVAIYDLVYWQHSGCDLAPRGLDYYLFDTALVCEPETAVGWLERVTGAGAPFCFERASDIGIEAALSGVEVYRRRRFKCDPLWPVLGAEWTNRCNRAKSRALKLAAPARQRDRIAVSA